MQSARRLHATGDSPSLDGSGSSSTGNGGEAPSPPLDSSGGDSPPPSQESPSPSPDGGGGSSPSPSPEGASPPEAPPSPQPSPEPAAPDAGGQTSAFGVSCASPRCLHAVADGGALAFGTELHRPRTSAPAQASRLISQPSFCCLCPHCRLCHSPLPEHHRRRFRALRDPQIGLRDCHQAVSRRSGGSGGALHGCGGCRGSHPTQGQLRWQGRWLAVLASQAS